MCTLYVRALIDAASRRVWGHAPPGNFLILGDLRLILVHFSVIFAWLRQRALCFCWKSLHVNNCNIREAWA